MNPIDPAVSDLRERLETLTPWREASTGGEAIAAALDAARNAPPASGMAPLIVGLLVAVIGMSFGFNAGYAINPARDFAPRLFTAVAGWGTEVFRAGNGWWWVPLTAPVLGAVLGAWVYDACIGRRFPQDLPPTAPRLH